MQAQLIKVDLKVDPDEDIRKIFTSKSNYTVKDLQDALNSRCENLFNLNEELIAAINPKHYHFILKGNVRISHASGEFSNGYWFTLHADTIRLKSLVTGFPDLIFHDIDSSRHPEDDVANSKKFTRALQNSLNNFVEMMDGDGIFDFPYHPVFSPPIELNPEVLENKTIEEIKKLFKKLEKKLLLAIKAELKAGQPGVKPPVVIAPGLKNELNKMRNDFKNLKNDIKQMIKIIIDLARKLNKTYKNSNNLMAVKQNYIIVKITGIEPAAAIPTYFKETYIKPDRPAKIRKAQLKVVYIDGFTSKEALAKRLAGINANYLIPAVFTGTMAHNNGIVTITLPQDQYHKIFTIDSRFGILKEINKPNPQYPRIFIMTDKEYSEWRKGQ